VEKAAGGSYSEKRGTCGDFKNSHMTPNLKNIKRDITKIRAGKQKWNSKGGARSDSLKGVPRVEKKTRGPASDVRERLLGVLENTQCC